MLQDHGSGTAAVRYISSAAAYLWQPVIPDFTFLLHGSFQSLGNSVRVSGTVDQLMQSRLFLVFSRDGRKHSGPLVSSQLNHLAAHLQESDREFRQELDFIQAFDLLAESGVSFVAPNFISVGKQCVEPSKCQNFILQATY